MILQLKQLEVQQLQDELATTKRQLEITDQVEVTVKTNVYNSFLSFLKDFTCIISVSLRVLPAYLQFAS